jgi:fluoride exporter
MSISNVLAIAIGAVSGALSRFYITEWANAKFGKSFPFATFTINLTGCLAMGFFLPISAKITNYHPELNLLVQTGFLGSYTTFSTYGFDTIALWRNQQTWAAAFYWLGSAILGLGAVILGSAIARLAT